jgi:hypothetical protein
MTIYSFPTGTPSITRQTFELVTNTKTFQSPLSNSVQTVIRKGSHWRTTIVWENLTGESRALMQGFLSKLNGQEHRFYGRDYGAVRLGNAPVTDNPTLFDDRMGSSVVLNNVTGGITDYLKVGDYIVFNNELHIVTDDANSLATGTVAVSISPPVRNQTTAGDAVSFRVPNTVFMMTNNPKWTTTAPNFSTLTIEAIEDVLA